VRFEYNDPVFFFLRTENARGYKASMNTSSAYKPRRIFISAEDNKTVNSPGTQVVLTTEDY